MEVLEHIDPVSLVKPDAPIEALMGETYHETEPIKCPWIEPNVDSRQLCFSAFVPAKRP